MAPCERRTYMSQNQQRFQRNQQQHTSQPQDGHRPQPRNQEDQRRAFLWRERVRLELQVQALLARGESLAREGQHLQERKVALGNQLPKIAGQVVLSRLVGIRQLPSERQPSYEGGRLAPDEYRLQ